VEKYVGYVCKSVLSIYTSGSNCIKAWLCVDVIVNACYRMQTQSLYINIILIKILNHILTIITSAL